MGEHATGERRTQRADQFLGLHLVRFTISLRAMNWTQTYDPLGNVFLSTLFAAMPVVVLLGGLAFFHLRAHVAALIGLASALAIAMGIFGMPMPLAFATAAYGAAYGLLPIGWIVLNVIFL